MRPPTTTSYNRSPADISVVVGISGGVDSAVTAALLLEQGYKVQGLHMTNWDENDSYCSAAEDYQVARQVCSDLDIPLHRVNFSHEYQEKVFADFLAEIRKGFTPNPDVACNRHIKFGDFLTYAQRLGADKIATGHYARVRSKESDHQLCKGADHSKDQSYFLHAIQPDTLGKIMFPLGDISKIEVRRMANDYSLPNHARRDSTGICFIGERPFREFLQNYVSGQTGNIETLDGDVIGTHEGLMFYTLGQRQGLAIGGLKNYGDAPWYVVNKDIQHNVLQVVQGREHAALWGNSMQTGPVHWLNQNTRAGAFECTVKTRYRQADVPCTVSLEESGAAAVTFHEPVWAVTPGQYAVFYQDDWCLGGARISSANASATNERPNSARRFQARSMPNK
jgi:tRNA-specific 2-thiouridylase